MKISFEIARKPAGGPPALRTGALITSPVAQPGHAELLRDLQARNARMFRSYDAAMTTPLNQDFRGTFGSANAEVLTSLYMSRSRSRTLVKDDPHAKAIQRTFQNNVVGHDPFRLKMRAGKYEKSGGKTKFIPDSDVNRVIEQEWEIAGRRENFSVRKDLSRLEAYRIVEASAIRDGSILARHHRAFPGNKYAYALELLEADRLQESYMGKSQEGNNIRFSIERDRFNAPVAYYILTRHPGDVFAYNGQVSNTWRERVAARDIIHFNNLRDRAEQDIGFTELDCTIQSLHRDRQYSISLTYAAIASCCKPFWIKKDFPTGMQYTPDQLEQFFNSVGGAGTSGPLGAPAQPGPNGQQQGIGIKTNVMSPASTEVMDYGQSLMQLDPKFPIEAAHEFKQDNLREGAVGSGVAYQAISGNFQNMGFSASRMSELPQRDNFKVRQEHMIESFVWLHFCEWLKYAIMANVFAKYDVAVELSRLEELCNAAQFKGRRWPYVNPLQDAQCDIMMEEAGYKSPQQIQDELEDGVSLDELYSQFEEAQALQKAHGLDFSNEDPTTPTIKKGEVDQTLPEPDKTAQPPEKTGGKPTIIKKSRGRNRLKAMELLLLQGDGRNGKG